MKHFNEYSAVSFAEPYVKKTADFLGDAKERAKFKYCQEKKKIERRRKKAKIKDFIENSIGLILIIAGIIGGITAAIFIAKNVCQAQAAAASIKLCLAVIMLSKMRSRTYSRKKRRENIRKIQGI